VHPNAHDSKISELTRHLKTCAGAEVETKQGHQQSIVDLVDKAQHLETYKTANFDRKQLKAYKSNLCSQYPQCYAVMDNVLLPELMPSKPSAHLSFSALVAEIQYAKRPLRFSTCLVPISSILIQNRRSSLLAGTRAAVPRSKPNG
jgi:hypothetical protein